MCRARLHSRTYCTSAMSNSGYDGSIVIGRMPIMLRSSWCVLAGKNEPQLAKAVWLHR
ncbi:hypothetical protein KC19_VG179300 [Ceratodon purpureus]|uniref:DNA-directed RNA polymerase n=1 Tax=Ceratodon purpureus TaxID=3225 RepID=A0A8T0HSC3_CERPU|nr:hypothetical protein KC19_VG179300 [Ceratodon purpureus]